MTPETPSRPRNGPAFRSAAGPAIDAEQPARPSQPPLPTIEQCYGLWDRFGMLDHIREHSTQVALLAADLAERAFAAGLDVTPASALAAGLLHDLAKTYTISHGGNHSQLGGAWVKELTGNALLAQSVVHHVFWPFGLDFDRHALQLIVLYSDKRVRHTEYVTLDERFHDLYERYGKTAEIRANIAKSEEQARDIERILIDILGMDIHAHTPDSGRLV